MPSKCCDRCGINNVDFVEELHGYFCGACHHDILDVFVDGWENENTPESRTVTEWED